MYTFFGRLYIPHVCKHKGMNMGADMQKDPICAWTNIRVDGGVRQLMFGTLLWKYVGINSGTGFTRLECEWESPGCPTTGKSLTIFQKRESKKNEMVYQKEIHSSAKEALREDSWRSRDVRCSTPSEFHEASQALQENRANGQWHTPLISARRLRKEDHPDFEASLGYRARSKLA